MRIPTCIIIFMGLVLEAATLQAKLGATDHQAGALTSLSIAIQLGQELRNSEGVVKIEQADLSEKQAWMSDQEVEAFTSVSRSLAFIEGASCLAKNPNDKTQTLTVECKKDEDGFLVMLPNAAYNPGDTVNLAIVNGVYLPTSTYFSPMKYTVKLFSYASDSLTLREETQASLEDLTFFSLNSEDTSSHLESEEYGTEGKTLDISISLRNPVPYGGKLILSIPPRLPAAALGPSHGRPESTHFDAATFKLVSLTLNGVEKRSYFDIELDTDISRSSQHIIITSLTASTEIDSNTTISLHLQGFNNPLYPLITPSSQSPNALFSVSTFLNQTLQDECLVARSEDQFGNLVDVGAPHCFSVSQPYQLEEVEVSHAAGASHQIREATTWKITVKHSSSIVIPEGSLLKIVMPMDMMQEFNQKTVEVDGLVGDAYNASFSEEMTDSNVTLTVTDLAVGAPRVLPEDFSLKIYGGLNFDSVRDGDLIQFEIISQEGQVIAEVEDYAKERLKVKREMLEPNTFKQIMVKLSDYAIMVDPILRIKIMLQNFLDLYIVIPEKLGVQDNTCKTRLIQQQAFKTIDVSIPCNKVADKAIVLQNIQADLDLDLNELFEFEIEAIENPSEPIDEVGAFKIFTFRNSKILDIVDYFVKPNPFKITYGAIDNPELTFDPNTGFTTLSFQAQHSIRFGGLISFTIDNTYGDYSLRRPSSGTIPCQDERLDQICTIDYTSEPSSIIIQATTSDVTFGDHQFRITFSDLLANPPRFQGNFMSDATISTSLQGNKIDEVTFRPSISSSAEMTSCTMDLTRKTNRMWGAISTTTELKTYTQDGDYFLLDFPDESFIDGEADCQKLNCSLENETEDGVTRIAIFPEVGVAEHKILVEGYRNPETTRPIGPFHVSLFDRHNRLVNKCVVDSSSDVFLRTEEPSKTLDVEIKTIKSLFGDPANFSFSIGPGPLFNEEGLRVLPWIQLELPSCISYSRLSDFQILQADNDLEEVEHRLKGESLVFQIPDTIGQIVLVGSRIGTEDCFEKHNTRPNFIFRTFEDEALQYALEIDGSTQPQVPCAGNCKTCKSYDRYFCESCNDPRTQMLFPGEGKCKTSTECPSDHFIKVLPSKQILCSKCPENCLACKEQTGGCTQCAALPNGPVLLLDEFSGGCRSLDDCHSGKMIYRKKYCKMCSSECADCGQTDLTSADEILLNSGHKSNYHPSYCTRCTDPKLFSFEGKCIKRCPIGSNDIQKAFTLHNGTEVQQKSCEVQEPFAKKPTFGTKIRNFYLASVNPRNLFTTFTKYIAFFVVMTPAAVQYKLLKVPRHDLTWKQGGMIICYYGEYIATGLLVFRLIFTLNILNTDRGLLDTVEGRMPEDKRIADEEKLNGARSQVVILLALSIIYLCMIMITTSSFFRTIKQTWEEYITNKGFEHQIQRASGVLRRERCCCCSLVSALQWGHYSEYIYFWKVYGWVLRKEPKKTQAHFHYSFLRLVRQWTCLTFVLKHCVLAALGAYMGLVTLRGGLYYDEVDIQKMPRTRYIFYRSLDLHFRDSLQAVLSEIIEVVLFGTIGNQIMLKFIENGGIAELSAEWGDLTMPLESRRSSVARMSLAQPQKHKSMARKSKAAARKSQVPRKSKHQSKIQQKEAAAANQDSLIDNSGLKLPNGSVTDSSFQHEGGNPSLMIKSFRLASSFRESIMRSFDRTPIKEEIEREEDQSVEMADLSKTEKKNRLVDQLQKQTHQMATTQLSSSSPAKIPNQIQLSTSQQSSSANLEDVTLPEDLLENCNPSPQVGTIKAGKLEEVKEDEELEFEDRDEQFTQPIMTFQAESARKATERPDESMRSGFGSRDNSQRPLNPEESADMLESQDIQSEDFEIGHNRPQSNEGSLMKRGFNSSSDSTNTVIVHSLVASSGGLQLHLSEAVQSSGQASQAQSNASDQNPTDQASEPEPPAAEDKQDPMSSEAAQDESGNQSYHMTIDYDEY